MSTKGQMVVRVQTNGDLVVDLYNRSSIHQELVLVAPEIPVRRKDACWALPELIRALDGKELPTTEEVQS